MDYITIFDKLLYVYTFFSNFIYCTKNETTDLCIITTRIQKKEGEDAVTSSPVSVVLYFLERMSEGPEEGNLFSALLIGYLNTAVHTLDPGIGEVISLCENGEILTRLS